MRDTKQITESKLPSFLSIPVKGFLI